MMSLQAMQAPPRLRDAIVPIGLLLVLVAANVPSSTATWAEVVSQQQRAPGGAAEMGGAIGIDALVLWHSIVEELSRGLAGGAWLLAFASVAWARSWRGVVLTGAAVLVAWALLSGVVRPAAKKALVAGGSDPGTWSVLEVAGVVAFDAAPDGVEPPTLDSAQRSYARLFLGFFVRDALLVVIAFAAVAMARARRWPSLISAPLGLVAFFGPFAVGLVVGNALGVLAPSVIVAFGVASVVLGLGAWSRSRVGDEAHD